MSALDRFIAGEDRLSALLRMLPFHEAPERLAAKVRESALAAERQAEIRAVLRFAPPERLRENVIREAGMLHEAQAVRRSAVLRALAQGEDPERLFGGPLGKEARDWLRQEALRAISAPQAAPAPASSVWSFWRSWRFWGAGRPVGRRYPQALVWTFCFVMLCGLLLRLYDFPAPILSGFGLQGQVALAPGAAPQDEASQDEAPKAESTAAAPAFASEEAASLTPEAEAWSTSPALPTAKAPSSERGAARYAGALSATQSATQQESAPPDIRILDAAPLHERESRSSILAERHARVAPETGQAKPAASPPHPGAARAISGDDGVPPTVSPTEHAIASSSASNAQAPAPAPASTFPSPVARLETNKAATKKASRSVAGMAPGLAADAPGLPAQTPEDASLVIRHPAEAITAWRQSVADLEPPLAGERFIWRLFAGDTENAEVQTLADYLRHALPDGQTLSLHTDPALTADAARLEQRRVAERK
jgi:hypothetical protein